MKISAAAIYTVSELLSKTVDEAGPLSYILIWWSDIKFCSCKKLVCFKIFLDSLVDNILRKIVIAVRVGFEPVTNKLLVEGRLVMTFFITFNRPET